MKRRIFSLLMALVMVLTLSPAVFAVNDGLLTLTIEYYIQGTETRIAPSYKATLPEGSAYQVESPTVVGYKVADDSQQTVSGTLDANATVRVDYTTESKTASYTINYIGREIDGTEVTPNLATVTGETFIGEIITAEDKVFQGYVRDPDNLSVKVTGDGNAVLNVYYTETINPCIVFSTGGDAVDPITAVAGTDISSETAAKDELSPQKQGYIFAGWDWNGDGVHDDKDQPLATMPEEDLVINAIWTPGTSDYIVEYYFQDTEGDGYTRNDGMDEVRQAATESTVTASEEDEQKGISIGIKQGEDFYGFDYSRCEDATVTGDGLAILKLYYDREIWTINLHNTAMRSKTKWSEYRDVILPNQDNPDDIWLSFSGRYGSSFPDDFPTAEELMEHYDSLCPWPDYLYINLLWAAQSSWENADGSLSDDNEIYTSYFYGNQRFDAEDTSGSREINVYPFYAEFRSIYNIEFYLQDLNDTQSYNPVKTFTKIQDKTSSWYSIIDDVEGFTIVGGSYRSKEKEKAWPEPGDPPLNYDKTAAIPEDWPSYYAWPLVLTGNTYKPAREGYTFTGWYSDPELQNEVTSLGLNQDYAIYAGWEEDGSGTPDDSDRKYALHFVTNGGTFFIDKGYDPDTTVALDDKVPEREGYKFTGWYSDPELTDKITEVTMDRDTAVYAGWEAVDPDALPEEPRIYDVHFVLNGGFFTYETIVESPTGHWTPITSKNEETNAVLLPTEIHTYTQVHFVRQQYALSFYSDNEEIAGKTFSNIYYETPLKNYLDYQPSDELAKGRTFLGWCLSTDDKLEDTDEIIMVDENMTMPATDVYLHAVWSPPKYTVSFDSHGGTEIEDQTVENGTPAAEPEPPTKDGCTFQGWFDEDGVRWPFDQEITEDTELHAVWRPEGSVNYTVKHIVVGETQPFYTKTGTGTSGDTVTDRALGMGDQVYTDYMKEHENEIYMLPDASVKSLVLKMGVENVIVFY